MITTTIEKRVRALEAKMEVLEKTAYQPASIPVRLTPVTGGKKIKAKKLPKWLQDSLDDVAAGRVSGPFETVEEFMQHLQK